MRRTVLGPGMALVLVLVLAGCGEAPTGPVNQSAATGADAIENRLQAMPEGQRNAVFIRAIRDAGQECQHVDSSERAGAHQGFPVWNATCEGGGTWTIVITDGGTAQVLNAAESRLLDTGNGAAPENAQGQ